MKHIALVIGFILVLTSGAIAQTRSANLSSITPLDLKPPVVMAENMPSPSVVFPEFSDSLSAAALASFPSEPAMPQEVQGVFPNFNWEAYAGYTYVRFYAYPGTTVNRNGFDLSVAYYFHGGWLGAEGALTATFGSLSGQTSDLVVGAGGPKVRWSGPRGVNLWAHGLMGGTNFTPKTPYGNEGALAYEAGAGVDINSRHQRLAYRVEGDIVGARLFGTSQYSPKISVGVVYKF